MEAASRPPLELLPDLPVEEPLDNAATPREPPVLPAAAAGASAKSSAPAARDPEQTGLNFVDPEMFLAPGQESSAVQATTVATPKASEPLELVLEDPVVDDMLTAPSAAPAAAAPAPTPAAKSTAAPQAARSAARVPIARTASLGAAAAKLAAASAASKPKPAVLPLTRPPGAAADKATPAAAAATTKPAAASNLASWAQARANASQTTAAAGARAAPAGTSSPATTRATAAPAAAGNARAAATPKAATPAPAAAGASTPATTAPAAATPPMDRDFIARNQVVERYLSGRLPLKGATDFERFCHDHPQLLDDIGLPERVNAGLRLLEASGKPEPWQESARPAWQKPQFTLALASGVALLIVALVIVAAGSAAKNQRMIALQKQ